MRTAKELEEFFTEYMPCMKGVIEQMWVEDREDLKKFLQECYTSSFVDTWMTPQFYDMYMLSSTAGHSYTSPWDVL